MKPEGWQGCPEFALRLIENIFFPFKTPLAKDNSFTIKTVVAHTKKQNWKLGLWIDLTNTSKYYNPKHVEDMGVQYIKLALMGRESPSKKEIDAFIFYCDQFLSKHPDQIIGVHCTHGFNRTGFLICCYLCGVRNLDPHSALAIFTECRPPGIYRQNMVNDVVKFYGKSGGPPPPKVANPPWKEKHSKKSGNSRAQKNAADVDRNWRTNKNSVPSSRHQNNSQSNPALNRSIQSYLAHLSSANLSQEIQNSVLVEIRTLIEGPNSGSNTDFPGRCHHFLTQAQFGVLKANRYMVSWQPQDCFRYLLFLDAKGGVYLIDANSSVVALPIIFPGVSGMSQNIYSTLIEGIVLRRKSFNNPDGSEIVFEMTDILLYEGRNIWSEDIASRLQLMRQICNAKRSVERIRKLNQFLVEPLKFSTQPVWSVSNFWKMQRFEWSLHYPTGPNGLIFYPFDNVLNLPIFKWGCPNTISANFRLAVEPVSNGSPKFLICVDDNNLPVDELSSISDEVLNTLICLKGRIIECEVAVINETKSWVFKRESARRICSDSLAFVKSVWLGEMSQNVTTKEVFGYLGSVGSQMVRNGKNGLSRCEDISNASNSVPTGNLQDCMEGLSI